MPGTDQVSLSYSNRSAAHADMEMYNAALRDIDLALENGVPEDKKRKLCMRQIDCFFNLNKEEEAIELLENLSFDDKEELNQLKDKIIQKVLNKDESYTVTKEKDIVPTLEDCNR